MFVAVLTGLGTVSLEPWYQELLSTSGLSVFRLNPPQFYKLSPGWRWGEGGGGQDRVSKPNGRTRKDLGK